MRRFHRPYTHDEHGFTLVELLVAILIIGILAAIALPTFLNQQSKGYDAATKSNIRTAAIAEYVYASDRGGFASETLSGGDAGSLATIEPALKNSPFITATANGENGFTLTATSLGNGADVFTYVDQNGVVTRSCHGHGGGCPGNSW
jgi:prepilin-type N-terminal cleavage/methylation domain-containing protein